MVNISSLFFFFLHRDALAPESQDSVDLCSGRGPAGEALGRAIGESNLVCEAEATGEWGTKGDPSPGREGGNGKGRRGLEFNGVDGSSRRRLRIEQSFCESEPCVPT